MLMIGFEEEVAMQEALQKSVFIEVSDCRGQFSFMKLSNNSRSARARSWLMSPSRLVHF